MDIVSGLTGFFFDKLYNSPISRLMRNWEDIVVRMKMWQKGEVSSVPILNDILNEVAWEPAIPFQKLKTYETIIGQVKTRLGDRMYRKHVDHSLNVFVLCSYLLSIGYFELLNTNLRRNYSELSTEPNTDSHKVALHSATMASILHDVGRPLEEFFPMADIFENSLLRDYRLPQEKTDLRAYSLPSTSVRKWITFLSQNPIDPFCRPDLLDCDPMMTSCLLEGYSKCDHGLVGSLQLAPLIELISPLHFFNEELGTKARSNDLLEVLDSILGGVTTKSEASSRTYEATRYLERLGAITVDETDDTLQVTKLGKYLMRVLRTPRDAIVTLLSTSLAAQAIGLHRVGRAEGRWVTGKLHGSNVTTIASTGTLASFSINPVTCFLILLDELEEWDREIDDVKIFESIGVKTSEQCDLKVEYMFSRNLPRKFSFLRFFCEKSSGLARIGDTPQIEMRFLLPENWQEHEVDARIIGQKSLGTELSVTWCPITRRLTPNVIRVLGEEDLCYGYVEMCLYCGKTH